jgi:hypothetical protein
MVVPEQAENSRFKTYERRKQKDAENKKRCNLYSSPDIAKAFKMKGCEMGMACSTHVVMQNTYIIRIGKQKSGNHRGYSDMDVSINRVD